MNPPSRLRRPSRPLVRPFSEWHRTHQEEMVKLSKGDLKTNMKRINEILDSELTLARPRLPRPAVDKEG